MKAADDSAVASPPDSRQTDATVPENKPGAGREPLVAGAPPDQRDSASWPPAALAAIQRVLDRSLGSAGRAVRDTFARPERAMTAAEFVALWNGTRMKAMATVGADGVPHIAPVHAEFVNGRLRSTIFDTAVRRRDLQTNPAVAFTMWGANGAAAIVYGRAAEVPNSLRETRTGATGGPRRTVTLDIEVTRIYAMKGRDS